MQVIRHNVDAEEESLRQELHDELQDFEPLASMAGLPWIDKEIYRKELLEGARIIQLPRIRKLNRILREQIRLSSEILSIVQDRNQFVAQMREECCAFEKTSQVNCDAQCHKKTAEMLRALDEFTDKIILLIKQWRANLARPLPFIVHGENYLMTLAKQCSLGGDISLVSSHMRNTSKHFAFFYASTYDSVAAASLGLRREELTLLMDEQVKQRTMVEEQLVLAKMGVYFPVLKFRTGKANAKQGSYITDKRWKRQLVISFTNALILIERSSAHSADGTMAASQFATLSSHSLHIRYFRKWFDYSQAKKILKKRIEDLRRVVELSMVERRWHLWYKKMRSSRLMTGKMNRLLSRNNRHLQKRYIAKWFNQAKLWACGRAIQRGIYLQYYHSFLLLVVRRRLQVTMKKDPLLSHAKTVMECNPRGTCHIGYVRETVSTHLPYLVFYNSEETQRSQMVTAHRDELLDKYVQYSLGLIELYQQKVMNQYQSIFGTGFSDWLVMHIEAEETNVRELSGEMEERLQRTEMRQRYLFEQHRYLALDEAKSRWWMEVERRDFFLQHWDWIHFSLPMIKRQLLVEREERSRRGYERRFLEEAPGRKYLHTRDPPKAAPAQPIEQKRETKPVHVQEQKPEEGLDNKKKEITSDKEQKPPEESDQKEAKEAEDEPQTAKEEEPPQENVKPTQDAPNEVAVEAEGQQ